MSENSIKSGDYVRLKVNGKVSKVVIAKDDCEMIAIDEARMFATTTFIKDVERIDPKTAFLTELAELLRKYDAKIDLGFAGHDGENPYINITLGNNGDVEWTDSDFYNKDFRFPLTADNVFNYDKE